MGVYDGSFNQRFNLAVQGKHVGHRRSSKGGAKLPLSTFNIPVPRPVRRTACGKSHGK